LTSTPKERCKTSARNLMAFSGALLVLSVMASRYRGFAYIAAAFAPIAHETLIIMGRKMERENPPLYIPSPRGERIFFVVKGSHAEKMGLSSGDLLLSVNGKELTIPGTLENILSDYPPYLWITYQDLQGEIKTAEMRSYPHGIGDIGAVMIPRDQIVPTVEIQQGSILARLSRRFGKKG
jgi:membrane-associated protease RseP (regulator of RpoE activity)